MPFILSHSPKVCQHYLKIDEAAALVGGVCEVRRGRFRGSLFGARVCLVSLVHGTKQPRQTKDTG